MSARRPAPAKHRDASTDGTQAEFVRTPFADTSILDAYETFGAAAKTGALKVIIEM
jgi:hypothetical protein